MPRDYITIKARLAEQYKRYYLNSRTSNALAENIKDLTIDDIISLLKEVRDTPELTKLSISLSRRSNLFDKLVLMKGNTPNDWVLRLHTYNMVAQCDEPGYVISNLNRKIRDDENHIHEHSWQLTSRFLMGGFRNHQYTKTDDGSLFTRFNLVPTSKDGVSGQKSSRQAIPEGQTGIKEISDDLYQQGDLIHYPIEIPHKVETVLAPYVGMTMTLAHTSERHHENSIFYQKVKNKNALEENRELAIEAQRYNKKAHLEAINRAITTLELLKLCDMLAAEGFERFNRYVDPITKHPSPNNVLETELLPTIAMLKLQERGTFKERPITEELQGKSEDEIQNLINKHAQEGPMLEELINYSISNMHQSSLEKLIKISQKNLLAQLYTYSCETLEPLAQKAGQPRLNLIP